MAFRFTIESNEQEHNCQNPVPEKLLPQVYPFIATERWTNFKSRHETTTVSRTRMNKTHDKEKNRKGARYASNVSVPQDVRDVFVGYGNVKHGFSFYHRVERARAQLPNSKPAPEKLLPQVHPSIATERWTNFKSRHETTTVSRNRMNKTHDKEKNRKGARYASNVSVPQAVRDVFVGYGRHNLKTEVHVSKQGTKKPTIICDKCSNTYESGQTRPYRTHSIQN
uniref:C2H2-type domain-containing protein n=1 Tax=Panagrellus redivivus TaxID=6233 RepID=A0A7E4W1I1_PANRE